MREERWSELRAEAADWRAADDPYGRDFGGPLTLGPAARRFDVSVAWHAWVGARVSLRSLRRWQESGRLDMVWRLAQVLADGAGLARTPSTLVCIPVRPARLVPRCEPRECVWRTIAAVTRTVTLSWVTSGTGIADGQP